jgi:metal-responsive CopG/Arc/MetJ family transcriptional regulator
MMVTIALDRDMAATVAEVARQTTEGNRSMAIRQMIRKAAPAMLGNQETQADRRPQTSKG